MTEHFDITVENIMQELAKLGFANIKDYLKRGPDGTLTNQIDFSKCTDAQMAAVESIQTDEVIIARGAKDEDSDEGTGVAKIVKTKFKLHDKKGALVDMMRQLGGQFEKDKPTSNEPQKIIVEGGLPDGDTMPPDIAEAAAKRKAKSKASKPT